MGSATALGLGLDAVASETSIHKDQKAEIRTRARTVGESDTVYSITAAVLLGALLPPTLTAIIRYSIFQP
jgi:hypothetical protein